MRNKAGFLGILIAIGGIAAIVGAVMISGTGDRSADGDAAKVAGGNSLGVPTPAATGAPLDTSSQNQNYSITGNLPAATAGPGGATSGGTAGVGATGGGVGGAGGVANAGGGASTATSSQIIDRKIERNSTLTITVDNVVAAVNQIQAAASGVGGYVSQQNITETAGPEDEEGKPTKRQTATVQIRVPSEAYDNVISGLRGIAKEVTAEQSQTVEVTAQYTDLQSQLRNLTATETQYLALLERAGTIEEILTVSDRLASVRFQIEQVQGQINLIENLTSLATITINVSLPPIVVETVVVEPEPVKEPNFARKALDDAWEASENVLEFMGVAAITAGVVMIWVLVPGMVLLAGWRLFGSRRGAGPAAS